MSGFHKFIASGFGSGYLPYAPGTAGSLVAFFIVATCFHLNWPGNGALLSLNSVLILLVVVFFVLGIYVCNQLEKEWGHDSHKIVVDEMVGLWISLLFIQINWINLFLALILFRLFDIFKPWPIRKAEKWPRGWGVMGDDVLAGVFTNIAIVLINIIL